MTPEIAYQIDQERIDAEDAIAEELKLNGITDGAFGYLPQYTDNAYLAGYIQGIKQLPRDTSGRILHSIPGDPDYDYDLKPF